MLSDAQKRANEKWKNENKEKQKLYSYRSNAKKYVKDFATLEDLKELRLLIDSKIEELKKGNS